MYITREGCRLHYEISGEGKPPLVFLHGVMMSSLVFREQVAEFADTYRVVTIDLRGFGKSDKPETNYTCELFVADLKYTLDVLDIKRPILAGWSMGGAIAMAFAASFPDAVSKLVLIGATPCLIQRPDWTPAVPADAARRLEQLMARDYVTGALEFCRLMFPEKDSLECREFIYQIMVATPPHVTASCFQNLGGRDLRPILSAIKTPAVVLCGEADQICPIGASEYLAEKLDASMKRISGAGHVPFLTRADEFNTALREVL